MPQNDDKNPLKFRSSRHKINDGLKVF